MAESGHPASSTALKNVFFCAMNCLLNENSAKTRHPAVHKITTSGTAWKWAFAHFEINLIRHLFCAYLPGWPDEFTQNCQPSSGQN
jgi:hypothetical protein